MLISLKLKNFKKHEDLTINFTEGLNVIRGLNENGKSTVVQAVAYALYGARALPLSLDETVTWGKPASSLKVELTFQHDNQMYTVARSKSGAELVGESVQSSGQTEVTGFIERLFNTTASVAQATMLANQSELQGGLESSSTALIEKLANMSLIDELMGKVQEQLPTGSTKLLEAQLASSESATAPEAPSPELEEAATDALFEALEVRANLAIAETDERALKVFDDDVVARMTANEATAKRRAKLITELSKLPTDLALKPEADITALEVAATKQLEQTAMLSAWNKFKSIPYQDQNYGTVEAIQKEDEEVSKRIQELQAKRQECQVTLAGLRPLLITESACGLCGKDLSQVPEVVNKNIDTQLKISATEAVLKTSDLGIEIERKRKLEIQKLDKVFESVEKFVGTPFIEFDMTVVPPRATWTGGEVSSEVDTTDYASAIKAAKTARSLNEKAKHEFSLAEAKRETLQTQLEQETLFVIYEQDGETRAEYCKAKAKLQEWQLAAKAAEALAASAEAEVVKAQAVYEANLKSWKALQATRKSLAEGIQEQQKNNSLIKKLREARPAVAKQLWSIVLAGVSHYFSQVRGVQSVVTREGQGFSIDGKPVAAYSGSTKDSLALAVRVVLQKTFLPNIDFAIFDEVASACDDSRESEMLAMLSTCGLKQVVLVTHSSLADSYAANVIRI